ncbi:MAG TPA: hypothetical protein P5137_04785 [Candidatus Brocadiia bacterium]|nr:hypothetical protein [Candidatus Brocadiia bacterium]
MPSRKSTATVAPHDARARASDLTPNRLNPRDITPDAAVSLARSMRELGDLSPIIFNTTTGRLVGGHQRLSQLPPDAPLTQTESLPAPDAVGTVGYGHVEAHGTRWPVRYVAWDADHEHLAMLAANSPTLQGRFTDSAAAIAADLLTRLPDLVAALNLKPLIAAESSGDIAPLPIPKPIKMVWALVGVPAEHYPSIAPHLDALSHAEHVIYDSTIR